MKDERVVATLPPSPHSVFWLVSVPLFPPEKYDATSAAMAKPTLMYEIVREVFACHLSSEAWFSRFFAFRSP